MNNLKAPLAVLALGSLIALIVGEPGAIVLVAAISLMGYGINKAAN